MSAFGQDGQARRDGDEGAPARANGGTEDTLAVRRNGSYAETKLSFIERVVPPALTVAKAKRTRVYLDLFAGPGVYVDERHVRRDGSPIRALSLEGAGRDRPAFTDAVFVNLEPEDHAALGRRVAEVVAAGRSRVSAPRIRNEPGDANEKVGAIMRGIHHRAYVFAYADPESPSQWPWASVQALRARGHTSVDLYMLFPLDMGLQRLMSYNPRQREVYADTLDRFFPNGDWRRIAAGRLTSAQGPRLRHELQELYLDGLRGLGWRYANCVRRVCRTGEHRLYNMLFATSDEAARRLVDWDRTAEQFDLGLAG